MSVDVETRIEIDRRRAEVAAYAGDPDNAPEWYENVESVEWETPRPLAAGSAIRFTARFLGRQLVYTYRIKEVVAGERLVMATEQGPFPWKRRTRGPRRARPARR
jgi:hypothetical protein